MKVRNIITLAMAGTLALTLAACGSSPSSNDADKPEAATAQKAEEKKSDYKVSIEKCEKVTDYEGNDAVAVTFKFTNNSEETQSMASAVNIEVYQDGVQCDMAICDNVDTSGYLTNLKTGKSCEVILAYSISSDADVEVETYELVSLDKTPLAKKTFSIK